MKSTDFPNFTFFVIKYYELCKKRPKIKLQYKTTTDDRVFIHMYSTFDCVAYQFIEIISDICDSDRKKYLEELYYPSPKTFITVCNNDLNSFDAVNEMKQFENDEFFNKLVELVNIN